MFPGCAARRMSRTRSKSSGKGAMSFGMNRSIEVGTSEDDRRMTNPVDSIALDGDCCPFAGVIRGFSVTRRVSLGGEGFGRCMGLRLRNAFISIEILFYTIHRVIYTICRVIIRVIFRVIFRVKSGSTLSGSGSFAYIYRR